MWLEKGTENEVKAMCECNLYVKIGDEWSAPIPGLGGSSFVTNERSGAYTSDECFKMALTDAIGTACKALGMSADIYYSQDKDRTKYTNNDLPAEPAPKPVTHPKCHNCGSDIVDVKFKSGAVKKAHEIVEFTTNTYGKQMCYTCMKEAMKGEGKQVQVACGYGRGLALYKAPPSHHSGNAFQVERHQRVRDLDQESRKGEKLKCQCVPMDIARQALCGDWVTTYGDLSKPHP